MEPRTWPDPLERAAPVTVQQLSIAFWETLAELGPLVVREEHLLCATCTASLRQIVLELMLALNGITWPTDTRHLNTYLGESQCAAIQKTLIAPAVDGDTWIGQAVALVVIYRWYAPQLEARYGLIHPQELEATTLANLQHILPKWPHSITTN